MRQFKLIDFWISIGLMISSLTICIIEEATNSLKYNFLLAYFIVGGWQVISMLVHAYHKCFTIRWGARYNYHWITFIVIVTMPASFWVLIFTAPFMAIYYTWLCYKETYVKMQRPLALLK
jgi:hypothetical protein